MCGGTRFPPPCTLHPTPYTLHPTPYPQPLLLLNLEGVEFGVRCEANGKTSNNQDQNLVVTGDTPPTLTIRPNQTISNLSFTLIDSPQQIKLSIYSTDQFRWVRISGFENQSICRIVKVVGGIHTSPPPERKSCIWFGGGWSRSLLEGTRGNCAGGIPPPLPHLSTGLPVVAATTESGWA